MSPLFHKSEGKLAREAAGQAEFERLISLSPAELGVELMPAFGPDGPHGHGPNGGINILQVLAWVNDAHFARGISYISKLQEAVREGIQALDHAGLVITSGGRDGTWTAVTRLGQTALAAGTVAELMSGPATPEPPASG
jgi:hypothetical protein